MKETHPFAITFGIAATVWFGYSTNWQAAVALFILFWCNNITQD